MLESYGSCVEGYVKVGLWYRHPEQCAYEMEGGCGSLKLAFIFEALCLHCVTLWEISDIDRGRAL